MIRLIGLTKRYGNFTAVDNIDLDIPPGCLYGLLGPNGAGKTTTMRMIAGILQPTAGTITIGGRWPPRGGSDSFPTVPMSTTS
jgi:ABC-type multidrug transport system ATPase subunit